MKAAITELILALLLCGCITTVSDGDQVEIARRIFANECGARLELLTAWNRGEDFASLGIGHFIWYPAGQEGIYTETFPELTGFMLQQGIAVPAWLQGDCPWPDREAFMADIDSPEMLRLRLFLQDTMEYQTAFMLKRLDRALPGMVVAAPWGDKLPVLWQFMRVRLSAGGHYALVDYANFKGEGTCATERYGGYGWGLLQVLSGMRGVWPGEQALLDFARSAEEVLERRVQLAPPERKEIRWLPGWKRRIATYIIRDFP